MTAGVGQLTPIIAERAEGSFIYGKDGKQYLDFCCGIGVTNLGHCHPKVTQPRSRSQPQCRAMASDSRCALRRST